MHLRFFIFFVGSKGTDALIFFVTTFLLLGNYISVQAQTPTILSFKPTTICQGEPVTITGTNFTGATNVKLGSLNATNIIVNSATSITATVANQSASGTVIVTTPGGTATGPGTLTIMLSPVPVLKDISTLDVAFTNCDGSSTYQLKVSNGSTIIAGNNNYQIDWGDGSPPFIQANWPANAQTTHTYNSQGYFSIVFTITPTNGCTKSITYQFYNGKNPLSGLTTTDPTTGLCVPALVEFQIGGNWFNNSKGTTYELDFGDGNPHVTLQHPLNLTNSPQLQPHTYTTTSCPNVDFTATLKAINGCFTTTYTVNQIIIRKKPDADFSVPALPACVNIPVSFTNKTTNGYSGNSCSTTSTYLWDFGDGTTSTDQNPSPHAYTSPGTYKVTLTASNTACGMDDTMKTVTITLPSPAPVVSASPVVYCRGQAAVPLTATGTGLLWYTTATGGTGSPVAPTPSTNISGSVMYYVSQTVANTCESPRVPVTVTVNALTGPPSVVTPVQLCLNHIAAPLTASGTSLLWYTSATGGVGNPTPPTPSTVATGNTNYYVSQTINGCEGARALIVVAVNALPEAPGVNPSVIYCQNQAAVPLKATGSGLLWYTTATGGIGSPIAPTPATDVAGITVYYVSQVTGCGEGPRASITVTVNEGLSASINYGNPNLCNAADMAPSPNPPIPVIFTGSPGGTYSVSPATGLPVNTATGLITPAGATAGTYTIRYTVRGTNGCSDFSTVTTVTVSSTPMAVISYPPFCTSDAAANVRLTGTQGGTFTSSPGLMLNAATGTITPATSIPGTYQVTYAILPSSPCPGFVTTASITISKAPSATIAYDLVNLCNVQNTASTPNLPVPVTLTGTLGGSYSILPATGLPIDAATGTLNPSAAIAGTYTIRYSVKGTGSCSDFSTTTAVTVNSAPSAVINYNGSPYCRGMNTPQQVSFSGTQGGTFASTQGLSIDAVTGAINPAQSAPGIYTVTYTLIASAPCQGYVAKAIIQIDNTPVITFPAPTQSTCSGSTTVFIPSSSVANTNYTWSVTGPLPANVSGTSSGTSSGPNPVISLSFTNTGATSQSLVVQVIPSNPLQNSCAGASYNITLVVNPVPAAPLPDTFNICMRTPPVTLNVRPLAGNNILWYDRNGVSLTAAPTINTDISGQFLFFASQSNSYACESPKTKIVANVNQTAKIISSAYTNPTQCGVTSGSIVLQILDLNDNLMAGMPVYVHYDKFQTPYKVLVSADASGKITIPLTAGTYSGIYVETSGCISQKIPDAFILKDPVSPAQPVAGYNPPVCSGTQLVFTAASAASPQAGPVDYVWAGPAFGVLGDTVRNTVISFPSAKVSDAGTYFVYAIQNNCISPPTNVQVLVNQSPAKPRIVTKTPLCVGDDLSLQAFSSIPGAGLALNYVWRGPGIGFPVNAPSAAINKVRIQDAGMYSITVSSPETGCSAVSDTLIQVGAYPVVKFAQDTLNLPTGFGLRLLPVITNAADLNVLPIKKYEWTPFQDLVCNDPVCTSPTATVKNNICYTVRATNEYGCSGSDTICIKSFCQGSQIFVPNTFTPRGDVPENTKLMVRASGISSVKSFRVYNRWGKIVFEKDNFPPNNPGYGWDGTVNGKLADPGVYIYTVEVICENGTSYFFKDNVTLL